MRDFAERLRGGGEEWGLAGLRYDIDLPQNPFLNHPDSSIGAENGNVRAEQIKAGGSPGWRARLEQHSGPFVGASRQP